MSLRRRTRIAKLREEVNRLVAYIREEAAKGRHTIKIAELGLVFEWCPAKTYHIINSAILLHPELARETGSVRVTTAEGQVPEFFKNNQLKKEPVPRDHVEPQPLARAVERPQDRGPAPKLDIKKLRRLAK